MANAVARCVLPVPLSPIRITDSRSLIQEPSARAAIVACGIFGLSLKRKSSSCLSAGNFASSSRRSFAAFGAFAGLRFEERGEVGGGGLLLPVGLLGQAAEAPLDRGELQLGRVRLDQRFHRRRAGLLAGAHDRPPIRAS
jgi:hypothetical protein